jgi:hypothetical protein
MRIERWVFTEEELKSPADCHGEDQFVAWVSTSPRELIGVMVQRGGKATNLFNNGMTGVPDDIKELAEACESLAEPETETIAENWRDVVANEDGSFLGFAVQVGVKTEKNKDENITTFSPCENLEIAADIVKAEYIQAMLSTGKDGLQRTIVIPVILGIFDTKV